MGPSIGRAEQASASSRRAMVDNQIRTYDVTDQRVLAAFEVVPRELFLPAKFADLAYSDATLSVESGAGTTRSDLRPMTLARMIQGLDLAPDDQVLVVGAGNGYAAAVVAELCSSVVALESDDAFVSSTASHAAALGLTHCHSVGGQLHHGHKPAAPFTAILVCGAVERAVDELLAQLAPGGRLVTIETAAHEATRRSGKVVRFDKIGGDMSSRVLFDATAPVLDEFREEPAFVF